MVVLAGLAAVFPDLMLNPGALIHGHRGMTRQCLRCHTPFRGVSAVQCVSCHRPETIGIMTVAGKALAGNTTRANLHQGLPASSCIECHTEHKGPDARRAIRAFRHDAIAMPLRNNCNACHDRQKPKDALHRQVSARCAQCHDTGSWKSVIFDHGMIDAKLSTGCVTCHQADRPGDSLHSRSAACGSCHDTRRWKPATFDHDRYFRLDGEHRASCATCHTDRADYRKYTCYGCHEHSPSRIAAEHLEEGIRNYQNCIRCHRSGSGEGDHEGGHGRGEEGDDD